MKNSVNAHTREHENRGVFNGNVKILLGLILAGGLGGVGGFQLVPRVQRASASIATERRIERLEIEQQSRSREVAERLVRLETKVDQILDRLSD